MELRITKISTMCFVLSCPTLRHHKAIYKRMLQFPGEVQLYAQRVIHRFFSSRVVHQSVYHHILVLFGWYFSITEWYVSFCWVFRCTTRCADHCIWPVAVIADEMTERVIRNIAKSKMIFFFFFFSEFVQKWDEKKSKIDKLHYKIMHVIWRDKIQEGLFRLVYQHWPVVKNCHKQHVHDQHIEAIEVWYFNCGFACSSDNDFFYTVIL